MELTEEDGIFPNFRLLSYLISIAKSCPVMLGIAVLTQYHESLYRQVPMICLQMTQSTMFIQGEISEVEYKGRMNRSPQISEVLKAISDDKALILFNTVALSSGKTDILLSTMNLTRKQYYSKMERLSRQGLLVRKGGRYYLTTLGKVLYELQSTLGVALDNYWKLKAIDSLLTPPGLPEFELNKMIDTLLENEELKKLILTKLK